MPDYAIVSNQDKALLALGRELRAAGYEFTTVTPLTQERVNARSENGRARDLAGVFGWSRPFGSEVLAPPIIELMREADILSLTEGGWRSKLRLSSLGEQLFFHSAFPTTAADAVFFGPDTVRFVGAIRAALPRFSEPPRRAFDIGCGAGPGGLVIAAHAPEAEVLLGDINEGALRLARVNAALNESTNARVLRSDLLTGVDGAFDLIVSNPPYLIDPSERAYRHGGGDFGEGLSVRILEAALKRLAPGGMLVLYTGSAVVGGVDAFGTAAKRVLAETSCRWTYVEVDPDVFGEELEAGPYAVADRIAAVVLTVQKDA